MIALKPSKNIARFAQGKAVLIFCLLLAVWLSGCAASTPQKQPTEPAPGEEQAARNIADYYNADGSFSALALALEGSESARELEVKQGDCFAAQDHQYTVEAESFTFVLYTHPSLESAEAWWVDYFATAAGNGIVSVDK